MNGYRGVTRALQRQGLRVNHKRVLRIVRHNDLPCRPRRKSLKTTDSDHPCSVFANLIRNLIPTSIDRVCPADITYIFKSSLLLSICPSFWTSTLEKSLAILLAHVCGRN
ncbi:MAG: IS3 family transposase [Candidatus Hodarchaeota archaeon]